MKQLYFLRILNINTLHNIFSAKDKMRQKVKAYTFYPGMTAL